MTNPRDHATGPVVPALVRHVVRRTVYEVYRVPIRAWLPDPVEGDMDMLPVVVLRSGACGQLVATTARALWPVPPGALPLHGATPYSPGPRKSAGYDMLEARLQCSAPVRDGDELRLYRPATMPKAQPSPSEHWLRPTHEMLDGRFEPVRAPDSEFMEAHWL